MGLADPRKRACMPSAGLQPSLGASCHSGPANIRQQVGHTFAAMRRLYFGRIPIERVQAAFSMRDRSSVVELENMESEAGPEIMERPIGIEPTPEPWQVCKNGASTTYEALSRALSSI